MLAGERKVLIDNIKKSFSIARQIILRTTGRQWPISTLYDQDHLVSQGVSLGRSILYSVVSRGIIFQRLIHRIMGRRFPDGGLL